ncbi:MAG: hypothetical protein OFPII_43670 [Osedax symbiont Rs1]|nr:MAG: hypothetical protein OFPII_43670 [Osedax symbiont Rs1]
MPLSSFRQVFFITLFVSCAAVVTWGIFRATPPQAIFQQSDKLAHLLAFAGLAFTGRLALPFVWPSTYWPAIAMLSILMEYAQGQLQITRTSSIEDAIANLVGVCLAFIALKIMGMGKKYLIK